ncbi:mitochondrial S-adenosylmethionine carrier protein-like [Rhopilema esculentum]|uniref:mitochondrial S-adenosylmethionine carrier protein-like n=1 Tax=Rhopilema esculentum TaxID=499914 RepID=UPI0031D0558D
MMNKDVWVPLVAGGLAGTIVDVTLFPLDTIKTRLQSSKGFLKSGGFGGIYRGVLSAALGSFPGGAVFFCGYEFSKSTLHPILNRPTIVYMISASIGEMCGCLIRVPTEVVKQRAQANKNLNSYSSFLFTIREEGFRGLYRGYLKTVMREIPFSFIQFPIWEYLKKQLSNHDGTINALHSGLAGAISGAISGAITTPLDVVKTRVMLAEKEAETAKAGIIQLAMKIGRDEGVHRLFSGLVPRVVWLALGGFVFLGAYDSCRHFLIQLK